MFCPTIILEIQVGYPRYKIRNVIADSTYFGCVPTDPRGSTATLFIATRQFEKLHFTIVYNILNTLHPYLPINSHTPNVAVS